MTTFIPIGWDDVDWDLVRHLTTVLYGDDDGGWILVEDGGRLILPTTRLSGGKNAWADTSMKLPLETAGFRRTVWFPFAVAGDHLAIWCNGARDDRAGTFPIWHGSAEEAADLLRRQGDEQWAWLVRQADDSRRRLNDELFYEASSWLIEPRYLAGGSLQQRSGFDGSYEGWRLEREMICDAIDRSCSFLDVGCANGYLVECVVAWSVERGFQVQPYGVDISESLVLDARQRLPQWADRFWVGNAMEWAPPNGMQFDIVHTLLDYVPEHAQRGFLEHLLDVAVADGGRLLLSYYHGTDDPDERAPGILRRLGFEVAGETSAGITPKGYEVPSAWVEKQRH